LVDTITAGEASTALSVPTHLVVTISGGFNALALLVAAAAGGLTPPFFFPFLFFLNFFYSSLGQQASFFRTLCLCEIKGDLAGDSLIPLTPSNVYLLLLFVS